MVAIDPEGEIIPLASAAEPAVPDEPIIEPEEADESDEADSQAAVLSRRLVESMVEDMAERIAGKDCQELERHIVVALNDRDKFEHWIGKFCRRQREYAEKVLAPLSRTLEWDEPSASAVLNGLIESVKKALYHEDAEKVLVRWQRQRPAELGVIIRKGLTNGRLLACD
jgi:hypothetical protein